MEWAWGFWICCSTRQYASFHVKNAWWYCRLYLMHNALGLLLVTVGARNSEVITFGRESRSVVQAKFPDEYQILIHVYLLYFIEIVLHSRKHCHVTRRKCSESLISMISLENTWCLATELNIKQRETPSHSKACLLRTPTVECQKLRIQIELTMSAFLEQIGYLNNSNRRSCRLRRPNLTIEKEEEQEEKKQSPPEAHVPRTPIIPSWVKFLKRKKEKKTKEVVFEVIRPRKDQAIPPEECISPQAKCCVPPAIWNVWTTNSQ